MFLTCVSLGLACTIGYHIALLNDIAGEHLVLECGHPPMAAHMANVWADACRLIIAWWL